MLYARPREVPPFAGLPRVVIADDYGPVGKGASNGHQVLAANDNEYIIKGPSLTPGHPLVAANEIIAAQLAGVLSLPRLDCVIADDGVDLYFGSAWMGAGAFAR